MGPAKKAFKTIDEYIESYPKQVQGLLKKLRATIRKAAPKAEEKIAYGLATFTLNGNLVHFGAFKNHIGFFPTPSAIKAFQNDLTLYKNSKGTIQFPYEKRLPLTLITRIVKYRVKENLNKKKKNE